MNKKFMIPVEMDTSDVLSALDLGYDEAHDFIMEIDASQEDCGFTQDLIKRLVDDLTECLGNDEMISYLEHLKNRIEMVEISK